jgi:hypothetical protein
VGQLRRFAGWLVLATTVLSLAFTATPLAQLWFGGLIALEPPLAELARRAMWLALPLAGLTVLHSWYQGLLLNTHRTRGISEAVALYLAVDTVLLALGVAAGNVAGLYVALAAMTVASTAQAAWLWRRSRPALAQLGRAAATPGHEPLPQSVT